MTTATYLSTNRAVLKTNAIALTTNFNDLVFYQILNTDGSILKIQKVRSEYRRCGTIARQITSPRVANSMPMAEKIMTELLAATKLEKPCYGEILYHSDRFYRNPFLGMFIVVAQGAYHNVIEVQQHLSSKAQDHQIVHSEHTDNADAIMTAQRLYYSRVSQELRAYYACQKEYLLDVTEEQFTLRCAKQVIEADFEWVASNKVIAA